MPRRRKALGKGFRKSYSLSRLIIEQLAIHWVTRRDFLSKLAVDYYRNNEDRELSGERKRSALQQVSNILNHLKKKDLIHIIPRKFIVNVPRLLYLYHINLPKDAKHDVDKALNVDKYMKALHASAIVFQENLGISFPINKAYEITKFIINQYYKKYYGYLVTMDEFIEKASKMISRINAPSVNSYFNNRVLELVSRHLLNIIAMMRYEEFIDELLRLVRETVGHRLVDEVGEKWRLLYDKIMSLSSDIDFRTTSYARQFLMLSVDIDIITSTLLI